MKGAFAGIVSGMEMPVLCCWELAGRKKQAHKISIREAFMIRWLRGTKTENVPAGSRNVFQYSSEIT